jgi:hypothetical protein
MKQEEHLNGDCRQGKIILSSGTEGLGKQVE